MAEEEKKKDGANKCPKCDSEVHLVDKVGEHYCFSCETYYPQSAIDEAKAKAKEEAEKKAQETASEAAKEEKGTKPKGIPCPSCGEMTTPVKDSDSFYCYSCEEYYTKGGKVVEEKKGETAKDATEEAKPEIVVKEAFVEKEEEEKGEAAASTKAEDFKIELSADESIILDLLEGNKPVKEEKNVCPNCGLALTYVQKYDRWYCYTCRKYASKEGAAEEEKEATRCSDCGGEADYIVKYDRYYCRSCRKYLPPMRKEGEKAAAAATTAAATAQESTPPLCAICGKPTTWIATYERYYCYPCKKYAPKSGGEKAAEAKPAAEAAKPAAEAAKPTAEKSAAPAKTGPACATCGKPTTWIAKYSRYYCYHCQKYAPKEGAKEEKASGQKGAPPKCATCGKPTTWIAKYERYYCYPCKKYAPKQ